MTDVFISYKREDKAYARALAEALARRGLEVWWDVDLLPGERFTAEIEQVIERAKVAVVLWSERAIHSDYVLDEARLAKERGILVPARIDASQPPIGFRTVQIEDLSAWDAAPTSPVIAGLVDAVARRAGKAPEPDASDAETTDHLHGRDAEAKLWESIRTNPAPAVAEYRLYLDRYPDGLFADLARLRLDALETQTAEAERRARQPAPMKLVAGATAVVGLVLALLLVPPRLDEAGSVVGAWFPDAIETDETASDPVPPAGERDPDTTGEGKVVEEPVEADGATPAPARPEDLADLATFTDTLADGSPCGFCPEMVVSPAGTFTMGSPPEEQGRDDDEGTQREVPVERFALGRTEVTFAQYDACVDAGGCAEPPDDEGWGRGERPVINVSWKDAQAYVDWLSQATGETYRLPSEAEWEYAARAGTTTRFAFGDELSSSQANFRGNIGRTWEVGAGAANDWGLYDMHGNLWEWAEDCWHDSYEGAPEDASPWLQSNDGDCSRRVVRGGSWVNRPGDLRSASRGRGERDIRDYYLGFRVARTLTP